ncbi:MAG: sigma-70 family RNA polymerase sigma factor [Phycisphaerales bacterium]|nr:sigma-70 family RNA polymerase sigma factor [Phycisphaerales bacterium]
MNDEIRKQPKAGSVKFIDNVAQRKTQLVRNGQSYRQITMELIEACEDILPLIDSELDTIVKWHDTANAIRMAIARAKDEIGTIIVKELMEEARVGVMVNDRLKQVLRTITYREREVLRLRYGLSDGRVCSLQEVATQLETTIARIRSIEAKAIKKLKHPVRMKKLIE